ncbi:MAG: divalent-cation tolerance protein CutA [Verrucomicrobiae bacterium]|nr:divalent-cation tolerance protein CutA [Verrucomicrobiae bacterium]
MSRVLVGWVTCGSQREARRIAQALIEQRVAACVNIVSGIESHYRWEGRQERSREWLLMIKTTGTRMREVEKLVRKLHSYQVPEIIFVNMAGGSVDYLDWVRDSVK